MDTQQVVECPVCHRTWLRPCEQGACIERHGECIACRFLPKGSKENKHGSGAGTKQELDALAGARA